jgi:hypothetical protein
VNEIKVIVVIEVRISSSGNIIVGRENVSKHCSQNICHFMSSGAKN